MEPKKHRVKEYNYIYDYDCGAGLGWIYCTNYVSKDNARRIARKKHKETGLIYGIKNCRINGKFKNRVNHSDQRQ